MTSELRADQLSKIVNHWVKNWISYLSRMQSSRVGKRKIYTQTGRLSWTLKLVLGYNQFEWPTEPAYLFVCMFSTFQPCMQLRYDVWPYLTSKAVYSTLAHKSIGPLPSCSSIAFSLVIMQL